MSGLHTVLEAQLTEQQRTLHRLRTGPPPQPRHAPEVTHATTPSQGIAKPDAANRVQLMLNR